MHHFVLYPRHPSSDQRYGQPVEFDADWESAVEVARQYVREAPQDQVEGDLYISVDGVLNNLGTVTR